MLLKVKWKDKNILCVKLSKWVFYSIVLAGCCHSFSKDVDNWWLWGEIGGIT